MSVEDYTKVEESLFADTGEGDNRDYYEGEVSEVVIPDPEEASKKFIEKFGEEGVLEEYEEIDDDEEKAMESFSPVEMSNTNENGETIVISNIIKETAETDDMFNTRKIIYQRIIKLGVFPLEETDVYSRIITNKLWYGVEYSEKVENKVRKIYEMI